MAFVALVGLVGGPAILGGPAGADTAGDLSAARQQLADARAAANAAASQLNDAETRSAELDARLSELTANLAITKQRSTALRTAVRRRAAVAYQHRGGVSTIELVFSNPDFNNVIRGAKLLESANRQDNAAVRDLDRVDRTLHQQEAQLTAERDRQHLLQTQLEDINSRLGAKVATAQQAQARLEAQLASEQQAAQLAAQQRAAAAAELAQLRAASPASGGGAGQVIANPGGGSFQCPVVGAAYTDSYGPRGSGFHYGIDMFEPVGTPEVAVKAGRVTYVPKEGAGGNAVYLYADDGNVYYYAHSSEFVGAARTVSQGEVIARVGFSGNASPNAPHLHFEIRLGGANGQHTDPYPTLKAAGC